MASVLSNITGIDEEVLVKGHHPPFLRNAAQRISWASRRRTTRGEDIAYCLMGLLDVNMPILYGEGKKNAFLRLQEQYLKYHHDHSLFTWTATEEPPDSAIRRMFYDDGGILAESPIEFAECGKVHLTWALVKDAPFVMTNLGLSITLPILPIPNEPHHFIALLDCTFSQNTNEEADRIGIYISLPILLDTRPSRMCEIPPAHQMRFRRCIYEAPRRAKMVGKEVLPPTDSMGNNLLDATRWAFRGMVLGPPEIRTIYFSTSRLLRAELREVEHWKRSVELRKI